MMNILKRNIIWVMAWMVAMPLWAQEPEPPVITTVVDTVLKRDYQPTEYHAECSNHLPYMWRGKDLRATGVYYDTVETRKYQPAPVPAVVERDTTLHDTLLILHTIYSMDLTVNPAWVIERKYELRKGSRVEVRGKWYTEAGTYYDTIPSASTCDSILHITIVWAEHFRQVDTASICYGNSLDWHGKTLREEGIYWDSLKTKQGYDSVFQIYLSVHYPFAHYDSVRVCETDTATFFWRGRHIAKEGDYKRTYIDQYGCDSTYHLHLSVPKISPVTSYTEYFCRDQGYVWPKIGGTRYYVQKTFSETLVNVAGCDSVVSYTFIPRDRDFHSETIQHYEGTSVAWRDSVYLIDSIYQDTLVNRWGCDSIVELRLIPKYDLYRNVVRCKGDTAMFHREIITEDCTRHDTLRAVMGGDSIYHISYSFKSKFYSREYITICSNEYFEWTGHVDKYTGELIVLHEEGSYYDRHRNEAGCDSTYEIIVKHSPAYIKDSVVLICKDTNEVTPVVWYDSKGKKYEFFPHQYLDTIIRDTMRHTDARDPHYPVSIEDFAVVTGGCDSVFNFHLIITDRCSPLDSIPMCTDTKGQNIPVVVDGRTYTEPGLYSNKMPSSMHQELLMKDSTHTFVIWIAPKDTSYDTVRWCESRLPAVYHNGQKFYQRQTGDYQLHFTNRWGCDSLVYLHLDIIPTVYSPVQVYNQFCPGDTIDVRTPTGKVFTEPGEYTDTVSYGVGYEWEGCDSIIRYHIAYKPSFYHTETHYLSLDRATNQWMYNWLNHLGKDTVLYHTDGIYYDSCKNVYGCDSVYQLHLMYPAAFFKAEEEHLCANELPYEWRGKTINQSGYYYDSLYTAYKLDSIYQLKVTIDSVYRDTIVKHFCEGDYFSLRGRKITKSGNYNDTLRTKDACDSIFTYAVSFITASVLLPEEKHIAEGTSVMWHGQTLSQTGTYYDTLRATRVLDGGHACDSMVYSVKLYVEKPYHKYQQQRVCANQLPLIWHTRTINESGVYWDSCKNVWGLDSIYQIRVTVDSVYSDTVYHPMCQGDVFTIHGKNFTSSGIYRDTLTSASGCDSVVCHVVSFTTAATYEQQTLRCNEGQSVMWHGKEYWQEGTYLDTLRGEWGCDSICYSMHLVVNRSFYQADSVVLCTNELPYTWHNRQYYSAGVYWDSCRTAYQLDSVYRLRIDTLPDYFYSFTHFICEGSSYNFGGQVLTEPGRYLDHLYQQNGCDSTIRCVLNFAPHYFYDEKMTYVEGEEWPVWHGKVLDHEGYYYDSLKTEKFGCDSIHRVYLKKSQSYSFYEEKELCENLLPYSWQGQWLKEAGLHTAHYTTQEGRDSVYQINLVVYPSELTVLNEYICPGSSYKLYGKTYTKPGVYRDTMYTEEGCYDITELHLSYYNVITSEVHHQLCPGDSLMISGQIITQSGTYEEVTKSHETGCDSIIRHIVGFHTAYYKDESQTINPGDVYIWHRNGAAWPLSESGTYFDSCKNVFGCDSIYRLQLTVNQVEYHFPVEEVTVCESALPYVWQGSSYYSDTTAVAKWKTRMGRDSVYTLHLTVSRATDRTEYLNYCEGGSIEINGRTYTRSAQFTDTLTNVYGCDSVRVHYVVNFYPRYSITQLVELKDGECYHFGAGTPEDTLICTSGIYYRHFTTMYGCDSLVTLKVSACGTNKDTVIHKDLCGNETFTINGQVVSESGKYINYLKTANGCDSIVTYLINIHQVSDEYRAVSICHGDSYKWTGHWNDTVLTKPGIYVDSVRTPAGCYNTSTLKLSYKSQDWTDTLISMCADKLPYTYKGKKYFVDTVFYDTVGTNIHGCDSILRWHYEVNRHCSPYAQYVRCTNEIKYIEGLLIDHAGVYSVNRLTAQGEDSIYRFIVRDAQPYEHYTPIADACDSVVYQGKTYYARGKGKESFQVDLKHRTIDGCDSVEHLMLTIYTSSPKYTETATIADYQTYRFENQTYNTSGTHVVRHLNQHNCDSLRELVLTVLPTTYHVPDTFAFCQGDRSGLYIFKKWYYPTQDTVIRDTTWTGGMPHIYTALVNRHYPFVINSMTVHPERELCANYIVPFDLDYTVGEHSAMPEYYEYYFVEQDLEVRHDTITERVNGKTTLQLHLDGRGMYVEPGYYTFRIMFHSPSCGIADTAFTAEVLVRYPQEIMAANWNNVITLINENYNANGWILTEPYAWQVHNYAGGDKTAQVVPQDHAQPYIASDHLQEGDQVVALLYRKGYSKQIPSCTFTFTKQAYNPAKDPILVYPTVTAKSSSVHVTAGSDGRYRCYNTTGEACGEGAVSEGDNTVRMPASAGCYLMSVELQDGTTALERVIVY